MLNLDPPPRAIVAQTDREHRLFRLQAEWRMFPESRKLIEIDIAWHPEWGIAVQGGELVAALPGQPIPQPPSTRRRQSTPYVQSAPQNFAPERENDPRAMHPSFFQESPH